MSDSDVRIALARLDERQKAATAEAVRIEAGTQTALQLQAAEYQRRLNDLNHAHVQLMTMQGTYVPREVFDRMALIRDAKVEALEKWQANLQGRMWIGGAVILILAGAIAALPAILRG